MEQLGHQVKSRPEYAELAQRMKKVMDDIPSGKDQLVTLAKKLQTTYARKRALVEELGNILR